jgi:hypothetical protein
MRCGNLFAAVTEMAERPEIQAQGLRDHERTVRQLAEFADAVLPARFGSVVASEDALLELLQTREPALCRALALVAGCEQMTVRVYGEAPAVPATSPTAPLGPGTAYLAGKLRDNALPGLREVRPALSDFVRAEQIQHSGTPPLLASVYHLIERGRSAGYLAALDACTASLPVRWTASGPWPPYAFGRWEGNHL